MGWVYCQRRLGAYLALAALVLQIAVSFGHVDLDGIVGPDHLALSGLHQTVLAQIAKRGPVQAPADDDGYCPICASIFMVSSSVASEPPQLPLPDGFERIIHSLNIAHGVFTPFRVVFRSRAPPAA
jgi:hypothetical protein